MPRIGELFGVLFYLYYLEHGVPHIHAIYQNYTAVLDLDGNVLEGKLPIKKLKIAKRFIADFTPEIQEMNQQITDSKKGKAPAPSVKNLTKKKR